MDVRTDPDWKMMFAVEMGISQLSPVEQNTLTEEFGAHVFERTYQALLNACPPDKRQTFKEIIERAGAHADVSHFVSEHIPGAMQVMEKILDESADELTMHHKKPA